ncbi:MAG TPA: SLBB domain-containing protein [Candidatus Polarisedimenticolia bacterium]|nr:SLBB domain-containing protein [Candidatus Polarisedimenticolia bacterium]
MIRKLRSDSGCVLRAAAAAVALLAGVAARKAAPDDAPRLRLVPNGASLVLEIRTGSPVPPYTFTLPGSDSGEVQVSWQGRPEDYPRRTALGDARLPEVKIDPLGEDKLQLHLPLNALRLVSVDQSADSIRLHLVERTGGGSVSAPAPGGGPAGGGGGTGAPGGGGAGSPKGGGAGAPSGGGAPGGQGPVRQSGDYEIGPGDKIDFSVFGHDDLKRSLEVRSDGKANIPLLGDLKVAGKTTDELDEEVTQLLGRDYIVDPQVSIELKESAKMWVTVMGEVRNPGRYPLKRDMKIIDLMAAAGGITKDAGSRITIARHGDTDSNVQTLLVDRDHLLGDVTGESNLILQRNDVVTIGGKDYYYIRGEVARPGPYFLETGTTVLKAISVASGLTPFANRRNVSLLRSGKDGVQEKIAVNLKQIEDGKAPDIPLKPEDTIIVPRRVF